MNSRRKNLGTGYQEDFANDLQTLRRESPETIGAVARGPLTAHGLIMRLRLSTRAMARAPGGMAASDDEEVLVLIPASPLVPHLVFVEHDRFLSVPHVLSDGQLCVYLDASREWDPVTGARGFLDRLFRWFEEALADRFDPDTALFHAVGGHQYSRGDAVPVVCREEFDDGRLLSWGWLSSAAKQRLDLHRTRLHPEDEQVLVMRMPGPLFTGPGRSLHQVFDELDEHEARAAHNAWQGRVARRVREDAAFAHVVVNVPHPTAETSSLLIGRIDLRDGDVTRSHDRPIEWCNLFDERPSISTRRDKDRPVNGFYESDVVLLGCGGLGSWIAEYVVRAGCRSIEVVDYGKVSGGHLVRQNYTERDVTVGKADALASRLRAIRPELRVTAAIGGGLTDRTVEVLLGGGFVIDATVSKAIATELHVFDSTVARRQAMIAQVATDVASGSLGMVVLKAPGSDAGILALDVAAGSEVMVSGELEPYRTFWEPSEEDELIPARGCSVPTFHGSAADLAAVAAIQTNLVGHHANRTVSGTYLFALPHTGVSPHYAFLPYSEAKG